VTLTKFELIGF